MSYQVINFQISYKVFISRAPGSTSDATAPEASKAAISDSAYKAGKIYQYYLARKSTRVLVAHTSFLHAFQPTVRISSFSHFWIKTTEHYLPFRIKQEFLSIWKLSGPSK